MSETYSDTIIIAKDEVQREDEFTARLADWTPSGGYEVLTDAVGEELNWDVEHLSDGDRIGTATLEETTHGVTVEEISIDERYKP